MAAYTPLKQRLLLLKAQVQKTTKHSPTECYSGHQNPLVEQISSWLETMAPEQKKRPFTTEEVECLAGLKGKHGGRPAHHHTAQALRVVGFQPCRDWTVAGRNKRFWRFSGEKK